MKCNTCQNENYCYDGNHQLTRDGCADNGWCAYSPMTNADRIRAMSDEELAEFISEQRMSFRCMLSKDDGCIIPDMSCKECWLSWLKSPLEEDE